MMLDEIEKKVKRLKVYKSNFMEEIKYTFKGFLDMMGMIDKNKEIPKKLNSVNKISDEFILFYSFSLNQIKLQIKLLKKLKRKINSIEDDKLNSILADLDLLYYQNCEYDKSILDSYDMAIEYYDPIFIKEDYRHVGDKENGIKLLTKQKVNKTIKTGKLEV